MSTSTADHVADSTTSVVDAASATTSATSASSASASAASSPPTTSPIPSPSTPIAAAAASAAAASISESKSSTTLAEDSGFLHLVDDYGNFGCSERGLVNLTKRAKRSPSSTGYSIISIMGCQSTGKSTLLNLLFGTRFYEMRAEEGRQQTTKGIWVDAANIDDIIIMDLEGTDSDERGEDRTTFERQTSLYALSLAEVLILNILETDIGRYTASNNAILKTVFEVNLQVFQPNVKTTLFFVIRDFFGGGTPFSRLQTKLLDGIRRVWDDMRKPEKFQDTKIDDLFDFEFCPLPDKRHKPEEFLVAVSKLRARFADKTTSDYFWNRSAPGAKAVPAEGFGRYAHEIWETIRSNKDLNLPSQREMLATFRCDEIIRGVNEQFAPKIKELQINVNGGLAKGLGGDMTAINNEILKIFDEGTNRYQPDVVKTKRRDMEIKVNKDLYAIFRIQTGHLLKDAIRVFTTELNNGLSSRPESEFYEILESSEKTTLAKWEEVIADSMVAEFKWDTQSELQELNSRVQETERKLREEKLNQLSSGRLDERLKSVVLRDVNKIIKQADGNMWTQLTSMQDKHLGQFFNEIGALMNSYRCTAIEKFDIESKVKEKTRSYIRSKIESEAENVAPLMRNRFEKMFKLDSAGVPRKWSKHDDLNKLFTTARDEALKLLDLFGDFKLPRASVGMSDPRRPVQPPSPLAINVSASSAGASTSSAAAGSPSTVAAASPDIVSVDGVPLPVVLPATASSASKVVDGTVDATENKGVAAEVDSEPSELNIIISFDTRAERRRQFELEIEGALIAARAEQQLAMQNQGISTPMLLLIAYLGWDDLIDALTNPLKLFFLVIVGGTIWFLHQSGLLGPAIKTARTVFNQAVKAVVDHTNQIAASSASGNSSPPPRTRRSGMGLGVNDDGTPISPSSINMTEDASFTPSSGPPSSSGRGAGQELFRRQQSFTGATAANGALSRGSSFRAAAATPSSDSPATGSPAPSSARRSFTGVIPDDATSKKDA